MTTSFANRFPLNVRLALHGGTLVVGGFTYLYARLVCSYLCTLPPLLLLKSVLALSVFHVLLREAVFRLAPGPEGHRTEARHAYLQSVATWGVTGLMAFGLHLSWHPSFPLNSHLKLAVGYWLLGGGIVAQVEYLLFEHLRPSTASPMAQLRERLGHRLMEGYVLFTTIPVLVLLLVLVRMMGDVRSSVKPELRMVLDRSVREAALLAGVITVAALVAALAYGRSLRRDSERLLEAVRRVGSGDFQPAAATSRPDELGLIALGINDMADGLRLRERIREAFGRFVSPQVANDFIEKFARPGRATELGGQRRDVVLLFSDLRDFTPLSESLAPEELIEVLNGYFGEMVAAIQKHGGMVDKFIGDAVLAVFGLTDGAGNPAASAVAAACEMRERLAAYNTRLAGRGLCLRAGIGVHAGEVVAGYLGSAERLEFTVIGHTVNVAARIEMAYDYVTRKNSDRETDGFSVPSASLFAAGPIGKHFGAYLELDREPEATVDVVGSMTGVWGTEKRFAGFRVGQGHMLMASGGVAGFDRSTGISTPLAYDESITSSVPLRLGGDQAGAEAFVVLGGRNRTAVQLLNGVVVGADEGGSAVSRRDVALTNQTMWDDEGSGFGVAAYLGSALGLVPNEPTLSRRFYRLSATASKIVRRVEVMGGYVYGKDVDVPSGDARPDVVSSPAGTSYWLQGQYTAKTQPLTLLGRYERLNPDENAIDASRKRYLVGAVLPISMPEYFRWSVEVFRDAYQSASTPQRNGFATRLQVAF